MTLVCCHCSETWKLRRFCTTGHVTNWDDAILIKERGDYVCFLPYTTEVTPLIIHSQNSSCSARENNGKKNWHIWQLLPCTRQVKMVIKDMNRWGGQMSWTTGRQMSTHHPCCNDTCQCSPRTLYTSLKLWSGELLLLRLVLVLQLDWFLHNKKCAIGRLQNEAKGVLFLLGD